MLLPPGNTLGDATDWTFTYDLVVNTDVGVYTVPTQGTSTDAGLEVVTVPAGTFQTWKITSTWSQDRRSSGGALEERTSTFWYAEGVGLVRERTVDATSGAQVISKDLRSFDRL